MLKFISWNVNGLRACVGKDFENQFKELDADFFCLQETKMQEGQLDLTFEGYNSYWNYAEKKGYSGTAIYTKHQPLSVSYGMGVEEHDHEGDDLLGEGGYSLKSADNDERCEYHEDNAYDKRVEGNIAVENNAGESLYAECAFDIRDYLVYLTHVAYAEGSEYGKEREKYGEHRAESFAVLLSAESVL